ncbi:MAG: hypothetical protein N2201_07320, partial [candidate division WOR-3 bacterium]|nr:hypothetical protein [candidate division WOR-3 bacterium]
WQLSDQEKRIYPLQRISELKNRNAPKNEIDAMKANRTSWLEGFKENNQVNELVNKFDVNTWNNKNLIDLPAELASLRAIDLYFRQQINQPLINDDKIILLHSPTYGSNNEGPFCANVIHNIINRYN